MWSWQIKSHQTWIGMIVIGVIFSLLGLAMVAGSFLIEEPLGRWAAFGVGLVVLVVGIVPLAFAPRARRETGKAIDQDLVPATPQPAPSEESTPWSVGTVASALAHELEGTPYLVEHNEWIIRVTWDLGDRSWWVLAQKNGTDRAFETRLVLAGPGKVTRTDHWYALNWQAGVPVLGSWQASTASGRVRKYEKRMEWGTDRDGLSKTVDYTVNTNHLDRPVAEVLERAGWGRSGLGAEAKGALIVGAIGASAVVIVPLVFLIRWLVGG